MKNLKEIFIFWTIIIIMCLFTDCTPTPEEKVVILSKEENRLSHDHSYFKVRRIEHNITSVIWVTARHGALLCVGDTIYYKF